MSDFPSSLKVKHWYQCFVILGIAGAIASVSVKVDTINNSHALLLFIGFFLFGVGEWINHPTQTIFVPPNPNAPGGGMLTGQSRQPFIGGIFFDLLGLVMILAAAYKLFK